MRILFTSVGRRVELIQAFRHAAERLGISLLIYGADLSTSAPALFFCDRLVQPCPIHQPDYISRLVDICSHEHIDALIPTIDTDLLLLSQGKDRFEQIGTRVIISDEDKIHICCDKRLTSAFFEACGLLAPHPVDAVDDYERGFPCFIKPLNGSSSINAFKVDTLEELRACAHTIFDYIIQPYIEGTEYTVDIFCDFDGNLIYITPRERLAVRSGEVLKTRIAQDERIIAECKRLVAEFRPCGPITVQLIRQRTTGDDYYIEINPRFGGGAPLSMKAGADSAEVMLRLLSGQKIAYQPNAATDGALYSRYDQSVCTSAGQQQQIKAVIFDLDDTLYSEKEYVFSGFKALTGLLQDIPDAYDKLVTAFEDEKPAIDTVLKNAGRYTEDRKQSCMQAYRLHSPDIAAYPGVHEMLRVLRADEIKLGIITDGRPEGQRKKLASLGLEALVDEIIITDELGGESFRKPCDIAFRVMQHKLGVPYQQMLYVGDNLQKDFIAPTALGMQSLYFRNPDGLYRGKSERATNERIVTWTVNSKEEFVRVIQKIGGGVTPCTIGRGLLIIGAGGHGRVAADIARLIGRYSQIAFVDDADISYSGGIKVLCSIGEIEPWLEENNVFVAIGDNQTRKSIMHRMEQIGARFATLIHPSAVIADDVKIGSGNVVMANAVINCGSRIGKGVIVNTAATIDHDNQIGSFVHISPGAHLAGTVTIGDETWIGIGASISNNLNICGGCTIGAGSVVIRDIETAGTYVGVPAQMINVLRKTYSESIDYSQL